MRWHVTLRGRRTTEANGLPYNVQVQVDADNPLSAIARAMVSWGLDEGGLERIHVQKPGPDQEATR